MLHLITRQYSYRTASIIVLVSSAAWGIMWYPIRLAESFGVSALWVQFIFMAVPAIAIAPFTLRSTMANRADWHVYLMAGSLLGTGFVCYALGLLVGSVSKTTTLFYLVPIWATVLGWIVLGERADLRRWVMIASALAGCMLVMQINPLSVTVQPVDLLGLASGVLWGGGAVVLRRYPDSDFRNTTLVEYVVGSIVLAGAIWMIGDQAPSAEAAMRTLPLAFVFGALIFLPTMLIILRINQYLSPGLVSILMLTEILVAVVTAAIFLGESLDGPQIVGVLLIVSAGVGVAFAPSEEMESGTVR